MVTLLATSKLTDGSTNGVCFFFFNDTATTEIYTLSLHDALPISSDDPHHARSLQRPAEPVHQRARADRHADRKSTRLNSSHSQISYAVFCLKKKKERFRFFVCRLRYRTLPDIFHYDILTCLVIVI